MKAIRGLAKGMTENMNGSIIYVVSDSVGETAELVTKALQASSRDLLFP